MGFSGVVLTALIGAGGFGIIAGRAFYRMRRRGLVRKRIRTLGGQAHVLELKRRGIDAVVAQMLKELAKGLSFETSKKLTPVFLRHSRTYESAIKTAGLADTVTLESYCEARFRLGLAGAASGMLLGFMFSVELSVLLLCGGAVFGFLLPRRCLRNLSKERTRKLERHLPEMLDVLALGMRSGLSFERSLTLYIRSFDTALARDCERAQKQWAFGLLTREEALRSLAQGYQSSVFHQVIEGIIRSLRFGSSMASELETFARDTRNSYRSKKQEQAAKAPVKMMIPTGVLILPAMLILVLGPVLLELAGGAL